MGKELLSSINLTANYQPEIPQVSLFKVFHCKITARNAFQTCSDAIRWSDLDFGSIACFIYAQLDQNMYRDRKRDADSWADCCLLVKYWIQSSFSSWWCCFGRYRGPKIFGCIVEYNIFISRFHYHLCFTKSTMMKLTVEISTDHIWPSLTL